MYMLLSVINVKHTKALCTQLFGVYVSTNGYKRRVTEKLGHKRVYLPAHRKKQNQETKHGAPTIEYVTFKCASFAIMRSYAVNGSPTL